MIRKTNWFQWGLINLCVGGFELAFHVTPYNLIYAVAFFVWGFIWMKR